MCPMKLSFCLLQNSLMISCELGQVKFWNLSNKYGSSWSQFSNSIFSFDIFLQLYCIIFPFIKCNISHNFFITHSVHITLKKWIFCGTWLLFSSDNGMTNCTGDYCLIEKKLSFSVIFSTLKTWFVVWTEHEIQ